jgi:ubiquinone/menaquinone biosynthesis C-methylase UbiE
VVDLKKSWDKIAELYNDRYAISCDVVHYGPLCPGEDKLNLLGNISGKKVMDLGCGGGQNSVALAKMGADVTALDLSSEQINQAERLASDHEVSINFKQADISTLSFIEDRSFDMAISACSISYLENIDAVFRETYRILKPNSRFILSDMNPLQYLLDETESGLVFNDKFYQRSLRINWTWEFKELDHAPRFRHYVRMISDYVNSLSDAGFDIKKILEPQSTMDTPHRGFSEEIMKEYPYIAKHIPITFVIVCEK